MVEYSAMLTRISIEYQRRFPLLGTSHLSPSGSHWFTVPHWFTITRLDEISEACVLRVE